MKQNRQYLAQLFFCIEWRQWLQNLSKKLTEVFLLHRMGRGQFHWWQTKHLGISEVSFTDPNLVTGIFWYERHLGPLGDMCCPLTVLQNSKKSITKSGQASVLIESTMKSQWAQLLMPGLHVKHFLPSLLFDRIPHELEGGFTAMMFGCCTSIKVSLTLISKSSSGLSVTVKNNAKKNSYDN